MSARYNKSGEQYQDANSKPLSGGKLNFYQPGTLTRKDTYTTEAESVANANPVVLDAFGRCPDIWFTGQAKIVVTDADDVEIDTTDPIGTVAAGDPFADYSAATTYSQGEMVIATNGRYYRSIVNNNLNNEPSVSAAQWEEFRFLGMYNAAQTYLQNDTVVDGGVHYISLQGSNTGNTPASTPAYWRPLSSEVWLNTTVQDSNFTAVAGRSYLCDTNAVGAFNLTLPESPTAGDKVGFIDYAQNFGTTNMTIVRNPTSLEKIMALAEDMTVNVDYYAGELTYVDTTQGWILT